VKKVTAALVLLFLLPVLVAGAAVGSEQVGSADPVALNDIPPAYGRLYVEAASASGFDWELLAAVGKVECDHGRGDCYSPNPAGAMGPMQFMPDTWRPYRTASDDPPYSVYDARDAVFAAASKLAADGIRTDPHRALYSYNHSSAYVDQVVSWALRYGWASLDATSLETAVLSHPDITLRPEARADLVQGRVAPRLLGALLVLATEHWLDDVGPFVTGHSLYVSGTDRISNHALGRAVDIPVVDGVAVSASNDRARAAARTLLSLDAPLRPDELGSPWAFHEPGAFTDPMHPDHLHIGLGGRP